MPSSNKKIVKSKQVSDQLVLLLLIAACLILFAYLHILQNTNPWQPSVYNSYTLQALQWREGKIALDHDYPHLELAIYNNKYYVSFPPVPAIPIYFLTFVFGENVPDTLLIQCYALVSCLLVYRILRRKSLPAIQSAGNAFLFCFASSLLPLLQNGAVWYQAQILAFLFTIAAIERMQSNKPTAALFCFALSVGCRPFQALYGPILILYGTRKNKLSTEVVRKPQTPLDNYSIQKDIPQVKEAIRKMLPGIIIVCSIATIYAFYNYLRFDNIFEFGHNHLPEFSSQGGVQFSLNHLAKNIKTFVLGLPFRIEQGNLEMNRFGFSLFLANPILISLQIRFGYDLIKKQVTGLQLTIYATFVLHALLLLTHRTCGGFQAGARYFIDCIPYVLLYMLNSQNEEKQLNFQAAEYILLCLGFILAVFGVYYAHL